VVYGKPEAPGPEKTIPDTGSVYLRFLAVVLRSIQNRRKKGRGQKSRDVGKERRKLDSEGVRNCQVSACTCEVLEKTPIQGKEGTDSRRIEARAGTETL